MFLLMSCVFTLPCVPSVVLLVARHCECSLSVSECFYISVSILGFSSVCGYLETV